MYLENGAGARGRLISVAVAGRICEREISAEWCGGHDVWVAANESQYRIMPGCGVGLLGGNRKPAARPVYQFDECSIT